MTSAWTRPACPLAISSKSKPCQFSSVKFTFVTFYAPLWTTASWDKKRRRKLQIFLHMHRKTNFRRRKLCVLKVLIFNFCTKIFSKWWFTTPNLAFIGHFSTNKKIYRQFQTGTNFKKELRKLGFSLLPQGHWLWTCCTANIIDIGAYNKIEIFLCACFSCFSFLFSSESWQSKYYPPTKMGCQEFSRKYFCCGKLSRFYAQKQLLLSARLSHRNSVCPAVRLSVTRTGRSVGEQARITKFSPSAAWKTPVSGTVKLFHKYEGGHLERGR